MPNGILIIDKPQEWTSHDVVAKLRGLFREKRVGHGGTLDPMATGVLPVFLGRATRAVEFADQSSKEYLAGLRLGLSTDTQDITGRVLESRPVSATAEELSAVLARFQGDLMQVPPMYSAVKIGGKKLYELARKGDEVERKPRPITIYELEFLGQTGQNEYSLRVRCSKGTYIRTLCHDIGAALGCGGTLSSLRRTEAAGFSLQDAVTLDQVAGAAGRGEAEALLLPVDHFFHRYPSLTVGPGQEKSIRNGASFPWKAPPGMYRVYGPRGDFLMLGYLERDRLETIKSFFDVL